MKTLIELESNSNTVKVIKEVNGVKKDKTMLVSDFLDSLNLSLEKSPVKKNKFEEIISPLYMKKYNMELIQTKQIGARSFIYFLLRKKASAPMPLNGRMYADVGMPNLIFAIKVVNSKFSKLGLVAVKDDYITPNSLIYLYPFSNLMDTLGGSMCLGGNKIAVDFKDIKSVFKIPNLFFDMPNNMSGFSANRNSKGMEYDELLMYLDGKEFEDDLLVESKICTYEDWIKYI